MANQRGPTPPPKSPTTVIEFRWHCRVIIEVRTAMWGKSAVHRQSQLKSELRSGRRRTVAGGNCLTNERRPPSCEGEDEGEKKDKVGDEWMEIQSLASAHHNSVDRAISGRFAPIALKISPIAWIGIR